MRKTAEQVPDPHNIGAKRPSELKKGDLVWYYPVLPAREDYPRIDTRVREEAWQLGDGTWVVALEGKSGCVDTRHVAPRAVQAVGA